ncbi:hypothetical protein KY285_024048 [Solanum tuberosum]|nr:hypothetical protein KY289_024399 [Solanum tuberosum]KAH0676247.1 hypothetical protein KY285_024048 [Solanum tuberosum]
MGILYFINSFALSQLPDAPIHINDFLTVEDGRYELFPWGQRAFSRLMISWRQERTKVKQLYRLGGMPYALKVWVYECASVVNEKIIVKEGDYIPRILNWRVVGVGVKPKFKMFMSSIFTEELEVLDLPDNMGVSHSEHSMSTDKPISHSEYSMSTDKPTQDISDDIPGFEDFSSQPPDQVKKSFSIPNSAGPSFDPKEKKDFSEIEEVKQYPKEYVNKKFDDLQVLIKNNHTVLMKAVRKLKRKKIAARSIPISEEELIKEDNRLKNKHTTTTRGRREPPSTVDVPAAGNVSKKVIFVDTSKDQQAGEDVSNEVIDDVVEVGTKTTEQATVVQDFADKLQHNIPLPDKVSNSTTSTSICSGTQEAINALIAGLQTPLYVQPLSAIKSDSLAKTHQSVPDSKLPMKILDNEMVVYELSETPVQRNRMPSKKNSITLFD